MAATVHQTIRGLLSDAERARDEGAYLRIPSLFTAACRLHSDSTRVQELFLQAGIPETALKYPQTR